MQLTSTAATIISLLMATSADAAALLRRDDAHVADFRSFGKEGCGADNQGIWTVTESQLTGCQTFASASGSDEPVMSVELVDITEGCHLLVYPDDTCYQIPVEVAVGECKSVVAEFRSYLITC